MGRRSKKDKSDKLGYILIAVVVTILSAVAVFIAMNRGVEVDKASMCRLDGVFDRHIVILDMTDNYNSIQVQQIKHIIENIVDNLAVSEQLQLYFIDSTMPSEMKAELSLCNPGDGKGKSEIYSNPKLFQKRWEKRFHTPLMAKLTELSGDYTSTTSPILETIQAVNNIALPYVREDGRRYKVTIISDMIQNSDALSFFKTRASSLVHFVDSPGYIKTRTDLDGVDIDIVIVRRDKFESLQSRDYIDFWVEVLTSMSANVDNIKLTDG
jgi:hypothetical protein